jgi:hypothetical protein
VIRFTGTRAAPCEVGVYPTLAAGSVAKAARPLGEAGHDLGAGAGAGAVIVE